MIHLLNLKIRNQETVADILEYQRFQRTNDSKSTLIKMLLLNLKIRNFSFTSIDSLGRVAGILPYDN